RFFRRGMPSHSLRWPRWRLSLLYIRKRQLEAFSKAIIMACITGTLSHLGNESANYTLQTNFAAILCITVLVLFRLCDKLDFGKTDSIIREGHDIFERNHRGARTATARARAVHDRGTARSSWDGGALGGRAPGHGIEPRAGASHFSPRRR